MIPRVVVLVALLSACGSRAPESTRARGPEVNLVRDGEVHFGTMRQLTYGSGENAEAYWSAEGRELVFQSKRPPFECDQIFRVPADGSAEPTRVSTGTGRTTCAYFAGGDERILFASTHASSPDCPPVPDHSQGYVWPIYDSYEIYSALPDGSDLRALTDSPGYDAEATVCPVDGSILFTSTRDGDLDLYRMDADGSNVERLTDQPGYDGGAFFSADCEQIVWRASRPEGKDLEEYRTLLEAGLIRPGKLELFVARADGSDARQVTYLDAASFAPYFHPSGERILFSTNFGDPRGREFDIWAVNRDGSDLERITNAPGFDGFPMFSPDGTQLAFASNRNQKEDGETDIFVVDWIEEGRGETRALPVDGVMGDIRYLADDAREGRGVGTEGIDHAADYLAGRMKAIGLEPAAPDGYFQTLSMAVQVEAGAKTTLRVGGDTVASDAFVPASFSKAGKAQGKTVYVGYGVVSKDDGIDDYGAKSVKGRVAVIRTGPFDPHAPRYAHAELHKKAFVARERGAAGVLFVDLPDEAGSRQALPQLSLARNAEIGIPALVVGGEIAAKLAAKSQRVAFEVELERIMKDTRNVVGLLRAGADAPREGSVVIGAHYDHLGRDPGSALDNGDAVRNGADDNASGTASLLEVARLLSLRRNELARDVYFVAFTGEESGLIGSRHFVDHPPEGLALDGVVAMLNMDMVGRLRHNTAYVLGARSASEWTAMVEEACRGARIRCQASGGGYGPSDQTSFFMHDIPVLHWFTGAHGDYHKASDDIEAINGAGVARISAAIAALTLDVAEQTEHMTFQRTPSDQPQSSSRSFSASLGTIPDYAGEGEGMLLAGVRPGGPAEAAGLRKGDRVIKIGDTAIRSVRDLVYVLQSARPGDEAVVEVVRDGRTVTLEVRYGEASGRGGR